MVRTWKEATTTDTSGANKSTKTPLTNNTQRREAGPCRSLFLIRDASIRPDCADARIGLLKSTSQTSGASGRWRWRERPDLSQLGTSNASRSPISPNIDSRVLDEGASHLTKAKDVKLKKNVYVAATSVAGPSTGNQRCARSMRVWPEGRRASCSSHVESNWATTGSTNRIINDRLNHTWAPTKAMK